MGLMSLKLANREAALRLRDLLSGEMVVSVIATYVLFDGRMRWWVERIMQLHAGEV